MVNFDNSPTLEVHRLAVSHDGHTILEIDHLSVSEGEVLAVIGPNGAGKSTLLLALSQILQPEQGQIFFRGQLIRPHQRLAYRRRIGLVLQDSLLLDASVFDNVAAGLRFRKLPSAEIAQRTERWLGRFGVAHLRRRRAHQLSGGEAQRVSLARAFALNPDVLLLDEPFSALDAPTRAQLLADFQALLAQTSITAVFVTHDMNEALMLADRVAVILDGRLRQVGSPDEVFSAPIDPDVAAFVGMETIVAGHVVESGDGLVTVAVAALCLKATGETKPGQEVLFCLRPEDVTLRAEGRGPAAVAANELQGCITRMVPQGALVKVVVDCGFPLVALIPRTTARQMRIEPGQKVTAVFQTRVVHLIGR